MSGNKFQDNYNLHDLQGAYKSLKEHYEASVDTLSRNFDILKHSKNNTNYKRMNVFFEDEIEKDEIIDIAQAIIELKEDYNNLEAVMAPIIECINKYKNVNPIYGETTLVDSTVRSINEMTDKLTQLEKRTNKLKQDLPIVRSIQLFLRETSVLLGKFCTAVVNVFMKIEPKQQAEAAKNSMLMHFDTLKASINKRKEAIQATETQPHSGSGFDI